MEDASSLFTPSAKAASSLVGIFVVGLVGGYYPRTLGGILSAPTVRTLAACVLHLFSPLHLFSVLGRTLTPTLLYDAVSAALWCCVTIGVGLGVALAARAIARPPLEYEGSFLIAIVWGNAMSLPLLLMSSLTARGTLRDDAGAFSRAVSYVFVYSIPWWLSLYSLALEIAHRAAAQRPGAAAAASAVTLREVLLRALLQPPIIAIFVGGLVGLTFLTQLFWGEHAPLAGFGDVATLIGSGNVPSANLVLAGSLFGGLSDAVHDARAWLGARPPPADASAGAKLFDAVRTLVRAGCRALGERGGRHHGLAAAEAPPLGSEQAAHPTPFPAAPSAVPFSAGAGAVAQGSALQLLVDADGSAAPSHIDTRSVGSGTLPAPCDHPPSAVGAAPTAGVDAVAVSDGAAAEAAPVVTAAPPADVAAAPAATRMPLYAVVTIIFARLVVVPAVCFALFWAAQRAQVPLLLSDDPVLTLVVLVQAAMPSAQSLLIVTSNVGDVRGTKALSLLFIVEYPLACLVLVPWLMLALEFAGVRGEVA